MSTSFSGARLAVLELLQKELPEIHWVDGPLPPYFVSGSEYMGGVSNVQQDQHFSESFTRGIIKVQVYGPIVPDPENVTLAQVKSPTVLEDIAERIWAVMKKNITDPKGRYWSMSPTVINWPLDPNQMQTRIELQFHFLMDGWLT